MKVVIIAALLTLTLWVFAPCAKVVSCYADEAKRISEPPHRDETAPAVSESNEADRGVRALFVPPPQFEAFSLFVLGSIFLLASTAIHLVLSRRSKLKGGESTR